MGENLWLVTHNSKLSRKNIGDSYICIKFVICRGMKIIALLGMPGSGKTEVIEYLMRTYHWKKVYFGEVTFDEMKRRCLEPTQANERLVREDLRALHGKEYYARKVVEKLETLKQEAVVLVESLYSWDEFLVLKDRFGENLFTIAVHSSPKIRHARLLNRPKRSLTPEEARSRDYAQIVNLSQGGPIAMADFILVNEGTREELQENADKIIKTIIE